MHATKTVTRCPGCAAKDKRIVELDEECDEWWGAAIKRGDALVDACEQARREAVVEVVDGLLEWVRGHPIRREVWEDRMTSTVMLVGHLVQLRAEAEAVDAGEFRPGDRVRVSDDATLLGCDNEAIPCGSRGEVLTLRFKCPDGDWGFEENADYCSPQFLTLVEPEGG